jgi:ketosteroid isomerase-like protein
MKYSFSQRTVFLGVSLLIANTVAAQQMGKMRVNSALAEIERLHHQDIAATVSSNVGALVDLWSDDGVLISQGDRPLVGKAAIQTSLAENFAKNPTMRVLKYEPEVKNLELVGDVAYEWGYFSVTQKGSATSNLVSFRGRFLRVLKLQPNGSWKFVRVMWNTEGP